MILSKEVKEFSNEVSSKIYSDYNLKKSNWFNIGGKTKIYFKPDNLADLILFLKRFGNKEKIHILGAGSNTLISDKTFDGAVIKLGKNFSNISILPSGIIVAGSACLDKKLSDFALENEIGNFEFLACIPGTVGGGIRMNAGCFNKEFKDILISIQAIDKNGKVLTIPANEVIFNYRKNNLSENLIFLSASFRGEKKDKNKIKKEILRLKNKKDGTQPTKIKTSGSTFKNPINQSDKKVWELIKESVPLDTSFGGAYISDKHCNFFVNKNNASFEDMNKLIKFVEESVKKKTGIVLEKEIKILE
ncbi:UDP-N-acetylmuramate dehydrogenase [Candidatus Pelagibacter ubique]|uniref:UDP-N-acetylenolpyruvoylglucosamine reductase n=1 Tax=Pelagibacter ubique TaxID=198252 RepID=A0ABX1T3H3_PELUQ|nr:UDP-N-acetylmuramate dehydrogenase [Candidatus Pelagibacter ubique]NMN67593.1 UDP-N-acetylmuramate dehydrogenase [Candidatus Pelagibacter ubique]